LTITLVRNVQQCGEQHWRRLVKNIGDIPKYWGGAKVGN